METLTTSTDYAVRSTDESTAQCSAEFGVGLVRNQKSPSIQDIIDQLRTVRSYRKETNFRKKAMADFYVSPTVKITVNDATFEQAQIFIVGGAISITGVSRHWEFTGNFKTATAKFSTSAPAVDRVGTSFHVEFSAEGRRRGGDWNADVLIIVVFASEEDAGRMAEAVQTGKEQNLSDSD